LPIIPSIAAYTRQEERLKMCRFLDASMAEVREAIDSNHLKYCKRQNRLSLTVDTLKKKILTQGAHSNAELISKIDEVCMLRLYADHLNDRIFHEVLVNAIRYFDFLLIVYTYYQPSIAIAY